MKQFRFDPLWLEQPDFVALVQQWWLESELKLPDIAHSWHKKLKRLKQKITGWARNHYGQQKKLKQSILEQLRNFEVLQEHRPFSAQEYKE